MQIRSFSQKYFDEKLFQEDFRASSERYTQTYREDTLLHFHNCMEIGMCISGNGIEFINDRLYSFYPDCIAYIPQNCIHDSHIITDEPLEKPSEWVYIFVDLDTVGVKSRPEGNLIFADNDCSSLFRMMVHELENRPDNYREVFCFLMESFIQKANRKSKEYMSNGTAICESLLPAINYMTSNFNQEITIEDIAKSCNISGSHFRKVFRKYMNCSPLEYLNNLRLSASCKMLMNTELAMTEIAERSGFASISSFNRLFKAQYGVSPSSYRKIPMNNLEGRTEQYQLEY